MKKWYAKSKHSGCEQVEVKEHLRAVGALSKAFGSPLGMEKEAEMAGVVHDAGKFTDKFQDVLRGKASRVDHARASAAFLYWWLIETSKYAGKETDERISTEFANTNYAPILEAINAHHGMLLCYPDDFFSGYAEQLCFAAKRKEDPAQPSGYWVLRRKEDYHMDTGVQQKNDSDYMW